ncbi:BON domain-containing protein [bacterium]|nr:MAG: BON domain-containing protein [bacterium]
MNKIFITGLLALTATTAALSNAEARPGDRRPDRGRWQDRREEQAKNQRDAYADRIERAFNRDSELRRFDLDSDNKGRNIEIEGRVRTRAQRDRAYNIARRTAPGYRIVNRIVVR